MRNVAIEFDRMSELFMVMFKAISLLFAAAALSSLIASLSSCTLSGVAINLSFEFDKFSGEADEFGVRMRELLERPVIDSVAAWLDDVVRFCGDDSATAVDIGVIGGRDCGCADNEDGGCNCI